MIIDQDTDCVCVCVCVLGLILIFETGSALPRRARLIHVPAAGKWRAAVPAAGPKWNRNGTDRGRCRRAG